MKNTSLDWMCFSFNVNPYIMGRYSVCRQKGFMKSLKRLFEGL